MCGFPTGRYYIGKRTYSGKDLSKDRYTGSGNFCSAYFKKYGKEEGVTYIKEILEVNPSKKINDIREDFWIEDLWKTDPLCMNQKPGGDGGCGKGKAASMWGHHHSKETREKISKANKHKCSRAVNQYDLEGNLIATHKSITDAAKAVGLKNSSAITQCCNRALNYNSCGGFFWRFVGDEVLDFKSTAQKYEEQKIATKERKKKEALMNKLLKEENKPFVVDQFDLNGNYITSYKTIQEALRSCNGKSRMSIKNCCDRNPIYKKAYNYIWRWHGDELGNTNTTNACIKRVVQMDLDGNVIQEFKSITDAERKLKIHHGAISMCCNNKRNHAGGFKWKYVN